MATDYVDRVIVEVEGTIVEATEGTYNANPNTERVKPMTAKNRATGFVDGSPDFEGSMIVPEPEGGHVVNFNQLMLDRTLIQIKYIYAEGNTRSFADCRITEVDQPGSEGEGVSTTINWMALDMFLG